MGRDYGYINISKPRILSPGLSHDLQLQRDLEIVNARTVAELGPLPSGGLPTVTKQKYVPPQSVTTPEHGQANFDNQVDEAMNLSLFSAAATLTAAGVLGSCEISNTQQSEMSESSQRAKTEQLHITENDKNTSADSINRAIKQVMDQQYGRFNPRLGCWEYTFEKGIDSSVYCMEPNSGEIVVTEHGGRLYFFASNRSDIHNNPEYQYSQADLGLMGAFELQLDHSRGWLLLAASKDMDYGSIGDCGCDDAVFVRLGKETYGWKFVSGGTWQGVSSLYHSIIAPIDGVFDDLSEIPMQSEDDQDTEYLIEIDESDANKKMFPLVVTKIKTGSEPELIKVDFDHSRRRYALPAMN